MDVRQILGRGIQETRFKDESFSQTGLRDFGEAKPEIIKMEPRLPKLTPRTIASKNNSYS